MSLRTITVKELHERQVKGEDIDLIDVRTPAEYRECHVKIARNVPLDTLDAKQVIRSRHDAHPRPLYVICRSGGRSTMACEKLAAAGCTDVVNIEGGTMAWDAAGFPVSRGKKAMALERQVRIAAGTLVLLGAVLGYTVNPLFHGLSGAIGFGLIFSGITNTCAMGMVISKLPWNQAQAESACRSA